MYFTRSTTKEKKCNSEYGNHFTYKRKTSKFFHYQKAVASIIPSVSQAATFHTPNVLQHLKI